MRRGARLGVLRQRRQQATGIGVGRCLEHVADAAGLDQPSGIEHADAVAQPRYGAEVVADEQDRGAELAAQLAHQLEDGGLDGDVEAGGRLVHDQQRRLGHQRHGDDDALLLAAGQLVRIALHHCRRVGQPHLAEHGNRPRPRLCGVGLAVQHRHLDQLPADGHHRIEARHRVLVDHGETVAAQTAQLFCVHRRDVAALEQDAPAGDAEPAPQVLHDGECDRRLAAAGFTDEAVRLARCDRQAHVLDDAARPLPSLGLDRQAVDGQHCSRRVSGRTISHGRPRRWP